ncbi:transposase [Paenibacillus sp. JMULE4]|nr:transposase [Paenibacillus sp. JMULE4]NTZ16199.1 transposase [Paenibacillus sp. JMULE4]NTZ19882.1 transposase [Paenibacillus sp. JMULE4]NTZ20146.1 transposase [Paenibacillus sp. JMULE4]
METNVLKRIFLEHWPQFYEKNKTRIRLVVVKEIEKFLGCGNPRNGFKLLVCEGCHDTRKIPYRCKGRFCTTCSCGETEEWSRVMAEDVFQVNHRHVILTIDEGLRDIFLKYREMLKEFMDEAARLVQEHFEKKHKVTPGIIAGLHTFGSKLNFNPHVHMLVTMGGMTANGEWKTYDYIPFKKLRKQWQTVVLKLIRRHLTEEQKKQVQPLLQKAYSENEEGFYVHGPKQKGDVKTQLGYIGRYIRRPAIAIERIKEYDGEYVVFRYHDKTDDMEKEEKVTVEEFISRLIRHIPDEHFKMIRHYGLYARRIKKECKEKVQTWQEKVKKTIVKVQKLIRRRNWQERIKAQTGKDPMVCPKCQCYYEYKGEVCLEEGQLVVKHAVCAKSKAVLERMINDLTGIEETKTSEEEETNAVKPKQAPAVQRGRQISMYDVLAERRNTA